MLGVGLVLVARRGPCAWRALPAPQLGWECPQYCADLDLISPPKEFGGQTKHRSGFQQIQLPAQAPGLKDSASATSIDERHKAWSADMPDDEAALWDWLAALDEASRTTLLAHCVSFGVNASRQEPPTISTTVEMGLDVTTLNLPHLRYAVFLLNRRGGEGYRLKRALFLAQNPYTLNPGILTTEPVIFFNGSVFTSEGPKSFKSFQISSVYDQFGLMANPIRRQDYLHLDSQ